MKAGRTFRRAITLTAAVALLVGITGIPAGAEDAKDLEARLKEDAVRRVSDLQNFADGLENQAKGIVGDGLRALANGDVQGAAEAVEAFGQGAECAQVEAQLLFNNNPGILSYDLAGGQAHTQIVVPDGCTLSQPIPVTLVTWTLSFGVEFPLSDQLRYDTDSVTVQGPGTYNLTADLPRPTLDPVMIDKAVDINLGASADGPLGGILDGLLGGIDLDSIIDGIVGSLTPEQISGLLDFICPFQVDVVRADASAVPPILGGGGLGDVNFTAPNVDLSSLMAGAVANTGEIAAAGRDAQTAASSTLGASADEGGGGGLDLANLDWEVLCAAVPSDIGPEQAENVPVSTRTTGPADSGPEVAGATGPLPRTGTNAPGVAGTGLALIVAGWLVLTGNALSRIRRNYSSDA